MKKNKVVMLGTNLEKYWKQKSCDFANKQVSMKQNDSTGYDSGKKFGEYILNHIPKNPAPSTDLGKKIVTWMYNKTSVETILTKFPIADYLFSEGSDVASISMTEPSCIQNAFILGLKDYLIFGGHDLLNVIVEFSDIHSNNIRLTIACFMVY